MSERPPPFQFGAFGNGVLYRMCREEPRHTDPDVIYGKIWLIGRAYSAQIERKSGQQGQSAELYKKVAMTIANSGNLDRWLESVSDIRRIDLSNLYQVLAVHHRFNKFLKQLTTRDRPSFASKYLHFHKPNAFFIYDSLANRRVRKLVEGRRPSLPPNCKETNRAYADFALRCIAYRDRDDAVNQYLTPRELDQEFLGY